MAEQIDAAARTNAAEYSVSEISGALKRAVEDMFGNVRVRGEVSGYRGAHSSGHCYFSLKDDRARIEAVIWKGTFSRLRIRPEEGMEVIATGKLTTYPGSSKYQIVVDSIEPAGAGALMALLDERKRRLAAEGLFDETHKRPLPFMPRTIGVVTSPTGAVIRDIIHRITDRFPVHVLVWPVRVQGETTGAEVSAAIAGFNALPETMGRPDVLIVARGGGSLEDLWGFNDEAVVRAVAASGIPVISAVGHETDWTLIDLVADRRAPTPTGAAEMAVPVKAELESATARLSARLKGAVSRALARKRENQRALARALPSADALLALPRRRFDEAAARLARALDANVQSKAMRMRAVRLSSAVLSRRIGEARGTTGQARMRLERAVTTEIRALSAKVRAQRLSAAMLSRRLGDARQRRDRAALRLPACYGALIAARRADLKRGISRLTISTLALRSAEARRRLEAFGQRTDLALDRTLGHAARRLDHAARLAASLSHAGVLERGFAVVLDADGNLVKRAAQVKPGAALDLRFADGDVTAVAGGTVAARPRAKPKPVGEGDQTSLF